MKATRALVCRRCLNMTSKHTLHEYLTKLRTATRPRRQSHDRPGALPRWLIPLLSRRLRPSQAILSAALLVLGQQSQCLRILHIQPCQQEVPHDLHFHVRAA